jgi:hypothetical protein
MTAATKMHYARGLPDRAICGADIRRGGFTSDILSITCVRCQRIKSDARPSGSTVVSRTWRDATNADILEAHK